MILKTSINETYKRRGKLLANKPTAGNILKTKDGKSIKVQVQFEHNGRLRYNMYVNAIIDNDATGWYLSDGEKGLKCLIQPDSQQSLVTACGSLDNLKVSKLRVVKHNKNGTALICEVTDVSEDPDVFGKGIL